MVENGAEGAPGQELGQSCRDLDFILEGLGRGHLALQENQGVLLGVRRSRRGPAAWAKVSEGCFQGGLPPGGRERRAWRRSKPSSEKEGEARQGWFGTLFGCAWNCVELGKHREREDEDKLRAAVLDGARPRAAGGGESPTHTCRKHLAAWICSYLC